MNIKRIMVAAPGSGNGKTMVTCMLLKALKDRGCQAVSYKCGPDFIDPMFHEKVIGVPAKNLDTFFTGEEQTRRLFLKGRKDTDFAVLEGVMGLYDGLGGVRQEGSSYHLAEVTKTPILFVADVKGMGRSMISLLAGFLAGDREHLIRGIVLNRISGGFYGTMKPLIEEELHIPVSGYLPEKEDLCVESRHLGLILPDEVDGIREKLRAAAELFSETVCLERIVEIAESAPELEVVRSEQEPEAGVSDTVGSEQESEAGEADTVGSEQEPEADEADTVRDEQKIEEDVSDAVEEERYRAKEGKKGTALRDGTGIGEKAETKTETGSKEENAAGGAREPENRVKIAVARDEAFCFYYEDNLLLLKECGAKIVYFSPLRDEKLPDGCHGLLFGGGYPELYAKRLSENEKMRRAVREASKSGMPIVAECGGFLYLHRALTDQEGVRHDMAGVIEADCRNTGKSVRFGYVEVREKRGHFLPENTEIRGHEFHYFDSTDNGRDAVAVKPVSGRTYPCVIADETHWMGFPHLYYPSNPAFVEAFVEKAGRYGEAVGWHRAGYEFAPGESIGFNG